jgi:hypothetical protein
MSAENIAERHHAEPVDYGYRDGLPNHGCRRCARFGTVKRFHGMRLPLIAFALPNRCMRRRHPDMLRKAPPGRARGLYYFTGLVTDRVARTRRLSHGGPSAIITTLCVLRFRLSMGEAKGDRIIGTICRVGSKWRRAGSTRWGDVRETDHRRQKNTIIRRSHPRILTR